MRLPLRLTKRRVALAGAAALAAAVPLVSPAHGDKAKLEALPAVHRTLTIGSAVTRSDCVTTRLSGQRGVTTTSWTAPQSVSFAARLSGPAANDWDLAV